MLSYVGSSVDIRRRMRLQRRRSRYVRGTLSTSGKAQRLISSTDAMSHPRHITCIIHIHLTVGRSKGGVQSENGLARAWVAAPQYLYAPHTSSIDPTFPWVLSHFGQRVKSVKHATPEP